MSSPMAKEPQEAGGAAPSPAEIEAARELVRQARDRGVALTGPDGLLKALTKTVIETALDEQMSEHLGCDKHDPAGRNGGSSRNGTRSKTVLTPGRWSGATGRAARPGGQLRAGHRAQTPAAVVPAHPPPGPRQTPPQLPLQY